MTKVGIYGGSFNPIHIGHLIVASIVYEKINLDKGFFLPSFDPPHKDSLEVDFQNRYKMVNLAIRDDSRFELLGIEASLKQPNYSLFTMRYLQEKYDYDFYFIMGEDSFLEIEKWYNYKDFLLENKIVVVNRSLDGKSRIENKKKQLKFSKEIDLVQIPFIDISSSKIRSDLEINKNLAMYQVPSEVFNFILKEGLYGR